MVPPSVAGWRQPRGPGPRRWVPGSEGAAWHFRPLRTWNGERASGEDRRLGPEGEPSSCLPRPVPPPPGLGGIESQAGQEGGLAEVGQRWHGDKTDGRGRRGRPPPRGGGCGARFQRPPGHGTRLQKAQRKVGQGPTGGWAGGRARAQAEDSLPGLPAGLRESDCPSSRSTECKGTTNEMETRTAGGMTWPASHCPLLGRVIPSTTDVSSGVKERTSRERGRETGEGGEREEKGSCEPPVL